MTHVGNRTSAPPHLPAQRTPSVTCTPWPATSVTRKELVLRRFDDLERWSVTYCGSQHDGKGRHRGLLEHDEVMRLFAAPPVPK